MKKRSLIFSLMNCAVASFAATTVNDVTVIPGDPVAVNYVTAGDDAIVTVSFSVDGVALGDAPAAEQQCEGDGYAPQARDGEAPVHREQHNRDDSR